MYNKVYIYWVYLNKSADWERESQNNCSDLVIGARLKPKRLHNDSAILKLYHLKSWTSESPG